MTEDAHYTDRDMRLAEDLGGIKALLMALDKKMTESIHLQACSLQKCQDKRDESHNAMWGKIDKHGRDLAWIKGIGLGLQAVWAALIGWISIK